MRYRASAAEAWVAVELGSLTALYHRPSGTTHLLVEPAPQLLAALAGRERTLGELRMALDESFDLPDATDEGLVARLDELVGAGLVAVG